jgi:hypothetical protein
VDKPVVLARFQEELNKRANKDEVNGKMKELNVIISEQIKVGKELFEADDYQVYVSAVTLSKAEKCFIATIPSGQGKTIIMLLNALYEIV